MPRQDLRGSALFARRQAGRPRLQLQFDDVLPSTIVKYDHMLAQLNTLLSLLGKTSLDALMRDNAVGAIQIWVVLLMQIHYDCGSAGLSDVGNLLSGLSRSIRLSPWRGVGTTAISPDLVMKPLWKAFAHWKKVEPYEFRYPLPKTAVHALLGYCVASNQWFLLLFILLCFHCWLRPAECLGLHWTDLCLEEYLEVPGVVTIRNPKIRMPATQHVIIESPFVAAFCRVMKSQFYRSARVRMLPFTSQQLHVRWTRLVQALELRDILRNPRNLNTQATPGGLRSSGATVDFLAHENLDRVMWRGRWANQSVLKHYLQLGVYHLAALQFPESTRQLLSLYSGIFDNFSKHMVGDKQC